MKHKVEAKKKFPASVGRKRKGYFVRTLQIKRGNIKITFDKNIKGDLKDFMKVPVKD